MVARLEMIMEACEFLLLFFLLYSLFVTKKTKKMGTIVDRYSSNKL